MIVLGIFAFGMNPGACLLRDGELVAFGEEERFSRLKGSHGMFPGRAITACLQQEGIELNEVDHVAEAFTVSTSRHMLLGVLSDPHQATHALGFQKQVRVPRRARGVVPGDARARDAMHVYAHAHPARRWA